MIVFEAVTEHERVVAGVVGAASRKVLFQWRRISGSRISGSWADRLPQVEALVAQAQFDAALEGSIYGAATLADQGKWVAPEAFVNPSGFAGFASSGAPLATVLERPVSYTLDLIGSGFPESEALRRGGVLLGGIVQTQVRDAARLAAATDISSRPGVGYIRMVGPGACSRCIILAGKFFRWNQGFKRHPRCNCTHVQTTRGMYEGAKSEGYSDDPYELFKGMSPDEQDKAFGAANAEAIRQGADIFQVVNSSRSARGLKTAEGTSRRGYSSSLAGRRLTPEGIFREAGGNREKARRLLEEHNYILPGGQNPQGSIRGQRDGFGALGRGGVRVGARTAVEQARRTGVRDPKSRYTMTEGERRLFDADLRFQAVLEGRNPYSRDGKGWTPAIAARAEADYKRWLATGGQVF